MYRSYNIDSSLISYIEKEIVPLYTFFDKAHQIEHVRNVIEESLKLSQYYPIDTAMVYVIAAFHDIGLCQGREYHHLVSGEMMRNNPDLRQWFNEEQITIMAEAVEDHRASNTHTAKHLWKNSSRSRPPDFPPIHLTSYPAIRAFSLSTPQQGRTIPSFL